MQLSADEKNRLVEELNMLSAWVDGGIPGEKGILRAAGFPEKFINERLHLVGQPSIDAINVITHMEQCGYLDEKYSALGLLTRHLLNATPEGNKKRIEFFIKLIKKHQLILDGEWHDSNMVSCEDSSDALSPDERSSRSPSAPSRQHFQGNIIDFGIITAIPVEREAILQKLDNFDKIEDQSYDPRTYYRASIKTEQGGQYEIIVTMLSKMGNIESALATSDLMKRWNPKNIFMLGIAGGIKQNSIRLGDVVIAESILHFEESKIKETFERIRPRMIPSDSLLYNRALNARLEDWTTHIETAPPTSDLSNSQPKIHFGPIASGEKIVASKNFIGNLLRIHPKLLAVEMESAGVSSAITAIVEKTRFLSIRGICDLADASKNDVWHRFAAHSAAAWAISFIKSTPVDPINQGEIQPNPELNSATQNMPDEADLFFQMKELFDIEDFKTFCTVILGIDVDELSGDKKSSKIRELIRYSKKKGEFNKVQQLFAQYKDQL